MQALLYCLRASTFYVASWYFLSTGPTANAVYGALVEAEARDLPVVLIDRTG